jgi:hypothetical protein
MFKPQIGFLRVAGTLLSEIPRITPLMSEIVRLGSPLRAFARDPVGAFARVSIGAFARVSLTRPVVIGPSVSVDGEQAFARQPFWDLIMSAGPFFGDAFARDPLIMSAGPFFGGAFARTPIDWLGRVTGDMIRSTGELHDGGTSFFDATMSKSAVRRGSVTAWPELVIPRIKDLGVWVRDRFLLPAWPFGCDMSAFALECTPAF